MKWLIVVIFATMYGDVYIFTEPTFENREACMESVISEKEVLLQKLFLEYGRIMPIRGVNCLEEETINKILNEHNAKPQKDLAI